MIYNLGQTSESLYIVKSGRVALDVFYEIERTNTIPVAHKKWELQRTFQTIRRTILVLGANSMFGMEEILSDNPRRVIRARALEDTECLYANKKVFGEYFNSEDRERIKNQVIKYTDFGHEAKLLLLEIQNKRTLVRPPLFLQFDYHIVEALPKCNES